MRSTPFLVVPNVAPAASIAAYSIADVPDNIASRIKINPLTGCWEWDGPVDRNGYGKLGGRNTHRIIWEILIGPVPTKLVLDHREDLGCATKNCSWPAHLRPVTNRENCTRNGMQGVAAVNIRKDHCGRCGRPLDLLNTYWYKNRRDCRACIRRRVREYQARQREKAGLVQPSLDRLGTAA